MKLQSVVPKLNFFVKNSKPKNVQKDPSVLKTGELSSGLVGSKAPVRHAPSSVTAQVTKCPTDSKASRIGKIVLFSAICLGIGLVVFNRRRLLDAMSTPSTETRTAIIAGSDAIRYVQAKWNIRKGCIISPVDEPTSESVPVAKWIGNKSPDKKSLPAAGTPLHNRMVEVFRSIHPFDKPGRDKIYAVATGPYHDAPNAQEFVEAIKKQTGISLKLVPTDQAPTDVLKMLEDRPENFSLFTRKL